MGIRNKVTSEIYSITSYDPLTGEITGINLTEGNTDLGNVTTVFIGGGNPGEVLSTDGTGNLSWIPDGGGDIGNVTFNDINIIGTGNLHLQPDPANASAYLDIFLTAGPDIHIAGNGETVILGTDDFANVAVNVNGNVSIQANAGTPYTWTFGTDSNLTLADGGFLVVSGGIVGGGASPAPYLSGFSSLATTGALGNITASGFFIGNGSQLTDLPVAAIIANGTSNVSIATADGPILMFDGGDRVAIISTERIAIGDNAGITDQNIFTVAVGFEAGQDTQGIRAVAVGFQAGADTQGANAIAIGANAAAAIQGDNSIAVGSSAGNDNQGAVAIAIGLNSGLTQQGELSVAVGGGAGLNNQSSQAVAIGSDSGADFQGQYAVAVGTNAGQYTQGPSAVSVGNNAGTNTQGEGAVAIGALAGSQNQGASSIAIGALAGENDQPVNSIIINASGSTLDGTESGLYIDPVRNDTGNIVQAVYYNTSTKEITYAVSAAPAIGTMTSGANIAPTTTTAQYNVTALAVASNVDAPTGTPLDGQKLTIRILDDGTPRALTWNAIYEVIGTTLPTTTVANKYVYVGCIYNAQALKWDVVSVATQV